MKDIASDLQLSPATVCYALGKNWRAKGISPQTRQVILSRSRELGFRRNRIAAALSTRTTHTIGVVVPRIADMYADMLHGIESAVGDSYSLLLGFSQYEAERERKLLQSFEERMVDGLIIVNAAQEQNLPALLRLHESGLPMVQADRHFEGLHTDIIEADGRRLAVELTEYLLKLGHRRIAFFFSSRVHSGTTARWKGYESAMAAAGLPPIRWAPQIDFLPGKRNEMQLCYEWARTELEKSPRPTAIVTNDESMASGFVRALSQAGLSCPGDVSVATVGRDNGWEEGSGFPFTFTRMAWSVHEMGRRAAEMLLERLRRPRTEEIAPRRELIEGRFIAGASTAARVQSP